MTKFIQDKNYSKDPSEAVLVNREYEDQTGLYINTTVRFDGFDKDENYSIVAEVEYNWTDKEGANKNENVLVAFDVKPDENGTVILERVALLAYSDSDKSKSITKAELSVSFYSLEDSVADNFGNSHLAKENKTSCAYNMAQHAISPQYDDNDNIVKENNCGGILSQEYLINNDAVNLCNLNIKSER